MAHAHAHAGEKYYVPHTSQWPIIGSAAFFTLMLGAVALLNDWAAGLGLAAGLRAGGVHVHRLVRHRHRREPAGHLRPRRRPLVPHGNDVVHLLRGDVLRRVLRRAVLCARAVGAVARRRRHQGHRQRAAASAVRERLAHQWPGAARPARRRHLRDHSGVRPAGAQHHHPAAVGRHRHHRASRAARRQSRACSTSSWPRPSCSASCSSTCRRRNTPRPTRTSA